jgi:hypothetical protein
MNDVYAINLAKSRLREGYNRADEEMVLSIYGDTFSDMSFGMPSFYDSDARDILRARLKRLFHDYHVEMAVIIIDIIPNGDIKIKRQVPAGQDAILRDMEAASRPRMAHRQLHRQS